VRTCVIGGGLAGALLAWRLAQATTDWQIDLLTGGSDRADATAASGGAIRAYETDPQQRRLATASMVELMASQTLRRWSGFHRVESVYLPGVRTDRTAVDRAVAEISVLLPGSATVVGDAELARRGWAGVPDGSVAVLEQLAGFTAPDRFRRSVLRDGLVRRRVTQVSGPVTAVAPDDRGSVTCRLADATTREYDIVVVAAGPWTATLLSTCGLPGAGFRTKSIQYSIYPVDGWRPSQFVDELTGLFGRPTADGGLLLGLPTTDWGIDPDAPPVAPMLHDEAARLAGLRFPQLRLGAPARRVGAADCYCDQYNLSLRPVIDSGHHLFTFSGGSGGSVKTALAASHRAAIQLIELGQPQELASAGLRKGQT
jgi:glycine/D-amino acid oxidase-like deaminating enzyme